MRTYLDCIPCLMNQALRAAHLATDNEEIIKKVSDEVGLMIKDIPMKNPPPKTAMRVYRIVGEITGNSYPFRNLKNHNTRMASELYPTLKEKSLSTFSQIFEPLPPACVLPGKAIVTN